LIDRLLTDEQLAGPGPPLRHIRQLSVSGPPGAVDSKAFNARLPESGKATMSNGSCWMMIVAQAAGDLVEAIERGECIGAIHV
jgi:hypothetical protein